MKTTDRIYIEFIKAEDRLRPLDEDAVARLVDSIKEMGLRTPIAVRASGEDGQEISLIAGRHRLEAAKRLGWEQIDCEVFSDISDDDAKMWQIAENLARADLTALERAEQTAEWIRLKEIKLAQVGPVSPGGRGKEGGVRAAARELGVKRTSAQRSKKIAKITPEAKAAAVDAGIDDNQAALEQVAAAEPAAQVAVVHSIADRRAAERARKEAEKHKANVDRVIAMSEAELFAQWLMARSDLAELPTLISWLEGTKPKDVIAAMRRAAA